MDPFIGELRLFGFNFAPRGWALCQGQLMSISQNTALFSLLGTMYGGNGQTTFGLPDLRGRTALGFGQGPGLSPYDQGQPGGAEQVTLLAGQLPPHNHTVSASSAATGKNPANSFPAYTADAVDVRLDRRSDDEPSHGERRRQRSAGRGQLALPRAELVHRGGGHLPASQLMRR